MVSSVLITGASGQLGRHVVAAAPEVNLLTPGRDEFDLKDARQVDEFIAHHPIVTIIHCAAQARMSICENDPVDAITTNIIGTANLVNSVLQKEQREHCSIRFVHISTDAVYQSSNGRYREQGPTIPYNRYGWSKLGAEACVNILKNYCIIRTRFFDPDNFKFAAEATDSYTSKLPVRDLAQAVWFLVADDFCGTINVGDSRASDYDIQKQYNDSVVACTLVDLQPPCPVSSDASMDISLWQQIKRRAKD